MVVSVVWFVLGVAAIWLCGGRLPEVGKRLSERLGISATALGLFILSIVTSLPELAVTLAAMLKEGAPDLALGNILGSNNFNLTSIVVLESISVGVFLHHVDEARYTRTCLFLLALTAIVGLGVGLGHRMPHPVLPVLAFSLPVVAIYALDSLLHRRESSSKRSGNTVRTSGRTAPLALKFALLSAAVVAGGFAVAGGANGIATHPFQIGARTLQLGQTFVGTLLVAVATSMPEVSVAYAAVRRAGSPDMALGTLLGSNTINVLVFAIGAPLFALRFSQSAWSAVSGSNLVSVVTALVLTLFVLAGVAGKGNRRGAVIARSLTILMVPVYLVGLYLVFRA